VLWGTREALQIKVAAIKTPFLYNYPMFDDLLQTKLFLPTVRSSRIVRQQLIDQLNQGATGRLCLISASAGSGKTTLAASWAEQSQRPVAWISLDQGDNEPTRFLAYLLAALHALQPESERQSSAPHQPHLPPLNEAVLTHVINEITRHSTAFSLVLDDYHLITESRIHETVAFILDNMPPGMNLLIISRQDPPLPLSRLRAQGQITEIRQADLRFSLDEAAAFLRTHTNLNLTQEDIAVLETRTEGWAVGLQLAAVALQSAQSGPHPVDTAHVLQSIAGSNRFILDYLIEEVLREQPVLVHDFLLQTAILDRLNGSLCDAVLDIESWRHGHDVPAHLNGFFQAPITSQQILEYLDSVNLFIIPLDYVRQWYRYHTLFADLLRQRLGQQFDPAAITKLHQRASQWYEKNDRPFKAIEHALEATDYPRAVCLIETYGQRALWEYGLYVTVTDWLDALPDNLFASNPSLAIIHAVGLGFVGRLTAAEQRLQMAEQIIGTLPEAQQGVLIGQIIVARLYIVSFSSPDQQSVERIKHALAQIPLEDAGSRGAIMALLGNTYRLQGEMDLAGQTLAESIQLCQHSGNVVAAIMAINLLGLVERARGRLEQALAYCRQAQELSTRTLSGEPVLLGITLLALAEIQYQRNELDQALDSLNRGIQLALKSGSMISQHAQTGLITLARIRQAQGDYLAAAQALRQCQSPASTPAILAHLATQQARLDLSQGNIPAAGQWADGIRLDPERFGSHTFDDEMSTLARVRIAQGQAAMALDLLTQARAAALADGRSGDVLEISLLQALAFQAKGDRPAALDALATALRHGKAEGYVRLFIDEGQAMVTLLRQAARAGIVPEYAAQLLAAFPATEKRFEMTTENQPLPDPLSARELDVLRLMAAGYSNPEIARELIVSVGTVKTHTNHIYNKLDARHRADAVKRAKALKLI
jgi:LuxR family maltose regulon positive regulatory protein